MTFIPVFRYELIPALLDGRGDIAAPGLTTTEAQREVDKKSERPTAISGSWPFPMISWVSICYHRQKMMADCADAAT
jgi:hypothetical protein